LKTLIIVESPTKARTIGQYLGDEYLVLSSQGHVRDLPADELGVDIEGGFEPPKPPAAKGKLLAAAAEADRRARAAKARGASRGRGA